MLTEDDEAVDVRTTSCGSTSKRRPVVGSPGRVEDPADFDHDAAAAPGSAGTGDLRRRFHDGGQASASRQAGRRPLLGIDGEHRWIRFAKFRLGHLFRYLPKQPGYHKRLTAAAPLLATAITHLARVSPSWCDQLRLIDTTPLPCGTSRETTKRSDLAGHAGYGYCAAHSRFYWGLKLYLLAAPDGMPIAWCLADPKIGEREVCLDLLTIAVETGRLRPGATVLADKGLAGREIEAQIAQLDVTMLRPDRRDERARHGNLGGVQQWIESVFDTLQGQLGLERHGGRTSQGVGVRVTQRLLALATAIWHNWAIHAPNKRGLTAYDH